MAVRRALGGLSNASPPAEALAAAVTAGEQRPGGCHVRPFAAVAGRRVRLTLLVAEEVASVDAKKRGELGVRADSPWSSTTTGPWPLELVPSAGA